MSLRCCGRTQASQITTCNGRLITKTKMAAMNILVKIKILVTFIMAITIVTIKSAKMQTKETHINKTIMSITNIREVLN